MARRDRMSGNEAVSYAIKQINPDVMPAFPITPSTEIPQMVSNMYVANQSDVQDHNPNILIYIWIFSFLRLNIMIRL